MTTVLVPWDPRDPDDDEDCPDEPDRGWPDDDDPGDCLDCGQCNDCIERTRAYMEQANEDSPATRTRASIVAWLRFTPRVGGELIPIRDSRLLAILADAIERREDETTPIGDDTGAGKMTPVSETDPVERARVSGFKSGRRSERAAIVAHLRSEADAGEARAQTSDNRDSLMVVVKAIRDLADATERGEHAVRPGRLVDDDEENAP